MVELICHSKGFSHFQWTFVAPAIESEPNAETISKIFRFQDQTWKISYELSAKNQPSLLIEPQHVSALTRMVVFMECNGIQHCNFHEYIKRNGIKRNGINGGGGKMNITRMGMACQCIGQTVVNFYIASPRKTVYHHLQKLFRRDPVTGDDSHVARFALFQQFWNQYETMEGFTAHWNELHHTRFQQVVEEASQKAKEKEEKEKAKAKEMEEARVAELREGGEGNKVVTPCVICMTQNPTRLLLPCAHLCMCVTCCERFMKKREKTCPLCRKSVDANVRCFY